MSKSPAPDIGLPKKKRGRPAGRTVGNVTAVRLPPRIEERLDAWATEQGIASRSDAIRRLFEKSLPKHRDPDKVPGLIQRSRKNGVVFYWSAMAVTRSAKGYEPSLVRLHGDEAQMAARCRKLTGELWATIRPAS